MQQSKCIMKHMSYAFVLLLWIHSTSKWQIIQHRNAHLWLICSGFQTCSWGPTALHILHVSLIHTPDSDHQLIRKGLHELKRVCQIRETCAERWVPRNRIENHAWCCLIKSRTYLPLSTPRNMSDVPQRPNLWLGFEIHLLRFDLHISTS